MVTSKKYQKLKKQLDKQCIYDPLTDQWYYQDCILKLNEDKNRIWLINKFNYKFIMLSDNFFNEFHHIKKKYKSYFQE